MDFKVLFIASLERGGEFGKEYKTLVEAVAVLSAIADYTLMLHECSLMADDFNVGLIMKKVGSEWIEIDDNGVEI